MAELIASIIVIALVFAAMGIGLLVSGRQIKGSCGGVNNLKKVMGMTPCEACKDPSPECPLHGAGN